MPIDERQLSDEGKAILDASRDSMAKAWGMGVVGAALGAFAGWFIFGWLVSQGFYALVLPGAAVGLGFGALSRRPMIAGGVFCAVVAFILTLACEWRFFANLQTLEEFLKDLPNETPVTFLMMGLGVLMAFWFGRGR